MKLDKELAEQLRIPTAGMETFNILRHMPVILKTGLYDEIKSTRFFRDAVQLHHNHSEQTLSAFFIQREDGRLHVVSAGANPSVELIREYLDPEVKADVILCDVPAECVRSADFDYLNCSYFNVKYGPLEFLAKHHPSHDVRVQVIAVLLEMPNAHTNTSQHTETT